MNRKNGTKEKVSPGHLITLHQRLYHALELGFRNSDSRERKWLSSDVEIQRLAVRSISSFIDGIHRDTIQLPLVKDSIPDIIEALEGILQLKNEALLAMTSAVAVKLVSSLPSSILQPHVHFVHPLASLLSFHQSQVAINCATSLKLVISNLRAKYEKTVWDILRGIDAVSQIISNLKNCPDCAKAAEYVTEMTALLSAILQRWPSSRYSVWSDDNLMKSLRVFCVEGGSSLKVCMLQMFSALALCGYGAKKLLDDEDLLEVIVGCMGKSHPHSIRIHAFRVFRAIVVSEQGCSKLVRMYAEPVIMSIVSGMTGRQTTNSVRRSVDEMSLLVESCQSLALVTRQPGQHHDLLWKYGIEKVLFELTLNSQSLRFLEESLSLEEMINLIQGGPDTDFLLVLRPFVWGALGWLVAFSDVDYVPNTLENKLYLKILITMTCLAYVESTGRKRQILQADPSNIYWIIEAAKATLMMLYSPCKFIASFAETVMAKVLELDGKYCLKLLLRSANDSYAQNRFQSVINMIGLACFSGMPQFYKYVIEDGGIEVLLNIIRQWLDDSSQRQKVGVNDDNIDKSCCRVKDEEWEGTEAPLLLALWSLAELLKLSCSEGLQMDTFAAFKSYTKEQIISDLQSISVSSNSSGLRWHASYLLSCLGVFGFSSKVAGRIGAALGEKEIADVKMNLKTGECFSVHGVILFVRCPSLLPPQKARFHKEVTLSAQVDHQALEKLLDFIYAGYVQVEEEFVRKLKIFARNCNLQLLLHLLSRRRPKWGDPYPIFDLTPALGQSGLDFSDIILEAKSTRCDDWKCRFCLLSGPHMHAHKIVLLSSCEYMRALLLSGMQESHSETLQVPVSLEALLKLANWFYSGELPKPVTRGCLWDNTEMEAKLAEVEPYIELCWLAEYWMLDELHPDCYEIVASSLDNATELAVKILQFSAELCQWNLVEFAANVAGLYYPSLRESGALDCLDDELIDMIRAASVRLSQSCHERLR